jgi:hypothetical protein
MKPFPINPWALALLTGAISFSVPGLMAQEPAQSPQDQGQSQQRDNGQATQTSFAGRITKGRKGKLMLVDPSRNISLLLDHQALAKKYEGKNVVVTGTLDETNHILRVKKIDLAA